MTSLTEQQTSNVPSATGGDAAPWGAEDWKRELAEIFFARRRVIFVSGLFVFIGAVLVAFFWPPTYQATASVLVRAKTPQVSPRLLERPELVNRPLSEEDVTSELQLLRSPELIKATLLSLRAQGKDGPSATDQLSQQIMPLVRTIQGNLKTEVIPSSKVIRIALYDKNPARAEKVLDALLEQYLRFRIRVFSPPEEAQFLADRADLYDEKLVQVEQDIIGETEEQGRAALVQKEMENNSDLKSELTRELHYLRADYERKKESLKPLEEALQDENLQFFAFLENEAMNRLAEQLAALVQERDQVARHYLPQSRQVKAIDEQVKATYSLLRDEAQRIYLHRRNEHEAIAPSIKRFEDSIRELVNRNIELQRHLFALRRMQRESELLESSYRTYATRSEEARINSAVSESRASGDVSILSKAALSAERAFPKPLPTLLVGLAAAIVVGLSFGFTAEYLDHSLNRPSDIHRHVNLPVICSIKKVE